MIQISGFTAPALAWVWGPSWDSMRSSLQELGLKLVSPLGTLGMNWCRWVILVNYPGNAEGMLDLPTVEGRGV